MGATVSGRVSLAAVFVIAAAMLHAGLCDWVLVPRQRTSADVVLWWIATTRVPPNSPTPSGRVPTIGPMPEGRFLRAAHDVSFADGWTFGVVAPVFLVSAAAIVLLPARRLNRLRKGHCPRCDYDLRFDASRPCSECGWRGLGWPGA
jgi:hypothetical protein